MRFVRDRVDVPVIADVSVFKATDALRLVEMQAADGSCTTRPEMMVTASGCCMADL